MGKEGIVSIVEAVVKERISRGEKGGPVMENAIEFVMALQTSVKG